MGRPVDLLGRARTEHRVGIGAAVEPRRGPLHDRRHQGLGLVVLRRVDGPRERARTEEHVGVARRIGERAEAALGEPEDLAALARCESPERVVDPRDHLVDVERLPHRLTAGAAVEPVRAIATAVEVHARVGDHGDEVAAGRRVLGVALVGPVRRAAARAVKEVEHRVAHGGVLVIAVGQYHAHVKRPCDRRARDGRIEQPRVDLLDALHREAVRAREAREGGCRLGQRKARKQSHPQDSAQHATTLARGGSDPAAASSCGRAVAGVALSHDEGHLAVAFRAAPLAWAGWWAGNRCGAWPGAPSQAGLRYWGTRHPFLRWCGDIHQQLAELARIGLQDEWLSQPSQYVPARVGSTMMDSDRRKGA